MTPLIVKREWLEPGFEPENLYDSPLLGHQHQPTFEAVYRHSLLGPLWTDSLESFAAALVAELDRQLNLTRGPIHVALSGGYDSRLLLALLERAGRDPLVVTDGAEEPIATNVQDHFGIPPHRRYCHEAPSRPDPYGIAGATIPGYAPLWQATSFFPEIREATLIAGLGGGEWFQYPATDWLRGKKRRVPGDGLVAFWMDTWPQFWLIPDRWAEGYRKAVYPYATPAYGTIAARARPEWVTSVTDDLDMIRKAMLDHVDPDLAGFGWAPHDYPWNLTPKQRQAIDDRFMDSPLAPYCPGELGQPSEMDKAPHVCLLAGFATWLETFDEEVKFV